MYDTLWNIIQSGDYDLPDITRKIDIFYAEGKINDDVIDEWKNEHMRTPYKQ